MAWLQNFAGKAENLLNKIDQNAAFVLNDSTSNVKLQTSSENVLNAANVIYTQANEHAHLKSDVDSSNLKENDSPNNSLNQSFISHTSEGDSAVIVDVDNRLQESNGVNGNSMLQRSSGAGYDEHELDPIGSNSSLLYSYRYSTNNSMTLNEELRLAEEKISALQEQNQQLSKELLNFQHLYYEVKNHNSNLQAQVHRANESVAAAKTEMEQYRTRAQRILQEKEKIISFKESSPQNIENNDILISCNEELKKELAVQQSKNEDLSAKLNSMSSEVLNLQQQFYNMEKSNQQRIQGLQEALTNERKLHKTAEEELGLRIQEISSASQELTHQKSLIALKDAEIENLKEQLKTNTNFKGNEYLESQLHSLTEMLLSKQSTLEEVTTERNALRLQLEKLQSEYHNFMSKVQQTQVKISNINDTDDVKSQVPNFMRVSAMDAGMTRKVKRAYGTLDTISIRTGVFLRRYPVARVFVFCYGILLHFWVIIILLSYVPSGRC